MKINLKTIKQAFKESDAIKGCKERFRLLTRNNETGNLVNELWDDFRNRLNEKIKENNENKEEKKENTKNNKKETPWHKFLSDNLKKGKKFKEIGELWKKEKEKNKKK